MNEALASSSRRAAEVLGADTPAGARFETSAELVMLVRSKLQEAMEEWRERLATSP
jgi:hypothetical protein